MTRDCTCKTHTGPHWLYVDYRNKLRNLSTLQRAVELAEGGNAIDASSTIQYYVQAETERLDARSRYLLMGEACSYAPLGIEDAPLRLHKLALVERLERASRK